METEQEGEEKGRENKEGKNPKTDLPWRGYEEVTERALAG